MNKLILGAMVLFSFSALANTDYTKTSQILSDINCLNGSKHLKITNIEKKSSSLRTGLYAGKTVNNDVLIIEENAKERVVSTYICPENLSDLELEGEFVGELHLSPSDKCSVGSIQAANLLFKDTKQGSTNFLNFFPIHMQTPNNLKLTKVCDEFAFTVEQFKAIYDGATEEEKSYSSNPSWFEAYKAAVVPE
jgi:hypothetical protein